jgi:NADH-quinone oxidoreductase subunit N
MAVYLARNTLTNDGILLAGLALLVVGLGFKVAAVPFHFWTPDVYQGSPTPFTGYMAAVAKAAGFAGLLRVLNEGLRTQQLNWRPAIWLIAVLTLIVGSLMAIAQRDIKRMLAYSSISQAGYVLVALQAASSEGTSAALFYLFTYVFIIMGSFAVITAIQGRGEARNDLGAIRGLARRSPGLAAAMLVFLLAQAGVPLTSGFLGKFYVIQAAIQRGQYALAIIAMLAAAIAAFFYLRVALLMYGSVDAAEPTTVPEPVAAGGRGTFAAGSAPTESGDTAALAGLEPVPSLDGPASPVLLAGPPDGAVTVGLPTAAALVICVVFTVAAGILPYVIDFARQASSIF